MASPPPLPSRPARRGHRPGRPGDAAAAAARPRARSTCCCAAPRPSSAPIRACDRTSSTSPGSQARFRRSTTSSSPSARRSPSPAREAAFRAVDFDAVVATARAARAAGATRLALVSALGADAASRVFYNRVKGETEAAVAGLGYASVAIARPSLLLGDREALGQPARPMEALAMRFSRPLGWLVPRARAADRRRRRRRGAGRRDGARRARRAHPLLGRHAGCRRLRPRRPGATSRPSPRRALSRRRASSSSAPALALPRDFQAASCCCRSSPGHRVAAGLAQQLVEVAQPVAGRRRRAPRSPARRRWGSRGSGSAAASVSMSPKLAASVASSTSGRSVAQARRVDDAGAARQQVQRARGRRVHAAAVVLAHRAGVLHRRCRSACW